MSRDKIPRVKSGWGASIFKKAPRESPVPSAGATSAHRQSHKPATKPERPRVLNKPGPRVTTKLARLPRDDEIRAPYVFLKEKDADGNEQPGDQPGELRSLRQLLAKLDRKVESLQVVVDSDPNNSNAPKWPIAVIVNKKEELARKEKEKQRQKQSAAATKEKELEVYWAMAPHDVDHKLRTLQKFLAKGIRVLLSLSKKRGKGVKVASKKEAEELLEKLNEVVAAVPGSTEWKRREGQILGNMKIHLQGQRQAGEEKEVSQTKASKAKKEQRSEVISENKEEEEHKEQHEEVKEEDMEEDPVEIVSRRI